jgi:PleD family two-component response regulator
VLRAHRRQRAEHDEVQGSLEHFDPISFTGHCSGVNRVSGEMSSGRTNRSPRSVRVEQECPVSGSQYTMRRPRVVLADDHKQTANCCASCSNRNSMWFALVEDGRALVRAAAQLSPDVIVADISMPILDGIDATARIRRSDPEARSVLVPVHSESILD